MKLAAAVGEYVTHKRSMGMRFCTEERTLKAFCRAMGDIAMTEVQRRSGRPLPGGQRSRDAILAAQT